MSFMPGLLPSFAFSKAHIIPASSTGLSAVHPTLLNMCQLQSDKVEVAQKLCQNCGKTVYCSYLLFGIYKLEVIKSI